MNAQTLGRVVSLLLLFALLTDCRDGRVQRRTIGQITFNIPGEFIIDRAPAWLPQLRTDELLLVLNPADPPQDQMFVSLEPKARFCKSRMPTPVVQRLCSLDGTQKIFQELDVSQLTKRGDSLTWAYRYPLGEDNELFDIASCSTGASSNGLCTSDGVWHGVIYSVSFRESSIRNLGSIHNNVTNKLAKWSASS